MTFSIAARCARTGMLGIAVSSSTPAVAARCAYPRAQVGAVGSQNITDPTLGPTLLDLMALGAAAPSIAKGVGKLFGKKGKAQADPNTGLEVPGTVPTGEPQAAAATQATRAKRRFGGGLFGSGKTMLGNGTRGAMGAAKTMLGL